MIFAWAEDGTLSVFEDLREVRIECEGIDVESGVWDFLGENGDPLVAVFKTPNDVTKRLFGLVSTVTSSQDFEFSFAPEEPWLLESLARTPF